MDFVEFLCTIYIMSHGTPEEKLERTFRMYDVDDSGTIDVKEMNDLFQVVYTCIV